MGVQASSWSSDALAWALNVSTSVAIVFANKLLLDARTGHGFAFATTLCGLHFMACALSVWAAQALGLADRAPLPRADVAKFALVASTSIAALNLSLLVNSVGFYQVTKLLIIPCVCALELALQKKTLSAYQCGSIATVVLGVGIVTVSDVHVSALGLAIALTAVVTSGLQQVMCGSLQRKHLVSSHQLLSNTAHWQGALLMLAGPALDQAVTQRWVLDYHWPPGAGAALTLSCGLAVAVNISQFMCLGRFSAVSFQVLGHAKTLLVLLASWLVLHEPMTARKAAGMGLALAGMVAYGHATLRRNAAAAAAGGGAAGGAAAERKRQQMRSFPLKEAAPSHRIRVSDTSSRASSGDGGGGGAWAEERKLRPRTARKA